MGPRRPFFKSCVFLPPTRRRAPPPPPRRRSPLAKCFSLSHPTPFVKGVPPRLTKNMQSTEGLHKIPTAAVGYSDFLIRRQCLSLSLSHEPEIPVILYAIITVPAFLPIPGSLAGRTHAHACSATWHGPFQLGAFILCHKRVVPLPSSLSPTA